ncbi:MAG: DNA methyltransferase [archaeon]
MRFVAIVSGDDAQLGAEELKQLSHAKSFKIIGQVVVFESKKFDYTRLAYTKMLYLVLFTSSVDRLEKDFKKVNWNRHFKESFRVDRFGLDLDLKYLGSLVWKRLKNPKVDLKRPKTEFDFIAYGRDVVVGKLLFENRERFVDRRPHLRPGFHPSSLQPKLARALINLADPSKGKIVADPFCGTGGILIEAGLMKFKVVGSDFSEEMVERCKENFKHFKIKGKCFKADARKVQIKADVVVTDPPYGICSTLNKANRYDLYKRFLDNAYRNLRKGSKVVIMFPEKIKIKTKFKVITEIDHYMHHSLTRHIVVFKKV